MVEVRILPVNKLVFLFLQTDEFAEVRVGRLKDLQGWQGEKTVDDSLNWGR